jgi:hypothetical protein
LKDAIMSKKKQPSRPEAGAVRAQRRQDKAAATTTAAAAAHAQLQALEQALVGHNDEVTAARTAVTTARQRLADHQVALAVATSNRKQAKLALRRGQEIARVTRRQARRAQAKLATQPTPTPAVTGDQTTVDEVAGDAVTDEDVTPPATAGPEPVPAPGPTPARRASRPRGTTAASPTRRVAATTSTTRSRSLRSTSTAAAPASPEPPPAE